MTTPNNMALPSDRQMARHWERVALRRRLLNSEHAIDVNQALWEHVDQRRKEAWGPADRGYNLYRSYVEQIAVLYRQRPVVDAEELSEVQGLYLASLNLWRAATRHQRMVLGLGESWLKLSWAPGSHVAPSGVHIDQIPPDRVVPFDSDRAPGVPVRIELASTFNDEPAWQVWDVEDPENPTYTVWTHAKDRSKRRDVTEQALGSRPDYAWIDMEGRPYLPWVLYHAEPHAGLYRAPLHELARATLTTSVLYSFFVHAAKNASWKQKVGLDVALQGVDKVGTGKDARSSVPTDPASILLFRSTGSGSGSISTLAEPVDPPKLIEAIRLYTSGALETMGLTAADVEKMSPESGVAIQLRRDTVREIQRSHVEEFRTADLELLEKVAKISNRFGAANGARVVPMLPEDGWRITYPALPMSREERVEQFTRDSEKVKLGVMSIVDLHMEMHPGMTREAAIEDLVRIQEDNARFLSPTTPPPQSE